MRASTLLLALGCTALTCAAGPPNNAKATSSSISIGDHHLAPSASTSSTLTTSSVLAIDSEDDGDDSDDDSDEEAMGQDDDVVQGPWFASVCDRKLLPASVCARARKTNRVSDELAGNVYCLYGTGLDCKHLFAKVRDGTGTSEEQDFASNLAQMLRQACLEGSSAACEHIDRMIPDDIASGPATHGVLIKRAPTTTTSSPAGTSIDGAIDPFRFPWTTSKPATITAACQPSYDPNLDTIFAANISGSTVSMNGSTVAMDGTTYAREATPEGTVRPVTFDPVYLADLVRFSRDSTEMDPEEEELFAASLFELQAQHDDTDWDDVARLGSLLRRQRPELATDTSVKHALAWRLQNPRERQMETILTASITTTGTFTSTMVAWGSSSYQLTKPTQTFGNQVFVATGPAFNLAEAAQQTPRPLPPACHKGGDKKQCRVQKCMLDYVYPIPITTVFPGIYVEDKRASQTHIGYFTQATTLTTPHWGTTKSGWTYWPMKTTVATVSGTPVTVAVRETPASVSKGHHVADSPKCHSYDTCCDFCAVAAATNHHFWRVDNLLMWGLGVLVTLALALLASLCCCCAGFQRGHRRRKDDPNMSRWEAMPIVGRAFRKKNADPSAAQEIVEIVHTQPPNGLAPAVVAAGAGAATGSAASGAGDSADGRGTLGRQAEEGRGRVNFAEGTQGGSGVASSEGASGAATSQASPGQTVVTTQDGQQAVVNPSSSQQVVTTSQTPNTVVTEAPASGATATGHETAPQIQPMSGTEVHRVDGAADYPSGSEPVNMGSMRGRKKGRKDVRGTFLAIPGIVQ